MTSQNTISYRESLPPAEVFFGLYETTGWNAGYGFSASDLHETLKLLCLEISYPRLFGKVLYQVLKR